MAQTQSGARPRRTARGRLMACLAGLMFAGAACESEDPFPSLNEVTLLQALQPVRSFRVTDSTNALLADQTRLPVAQALGERMFNDTGFGPCQISCATCHPAPTFADPGKAFSEGCGVTTRNTPSLLNVQFPRFFFWDGRADSVWSQAVGPLLHPLEIGGTASSVRARIVEDTQPGGYAETYQTLFGTDAATDPEEKMLANVGKVLQAYLWDEKFVSLDSPFDRALQEFVALAKSSQTVPEDRSKLEALPHFQGFKVFARNGDCLLCHKNGMLADDSIEQFHNIGVSQVHDAAFDEGFSAGFPQLLQSPFNGEGPHSDNVGAGRQKLGAMRAAAQKDTAKGAFRTPSLRNIANTGPYMHNGSVESLRDVVDFYDKGGAPAGFYPGPRVETVKPLNLSDEEKDALVRLLELLTVEPTAQ